MKVSDYPHMLTSYHKGWDELKARHPASLRILLSLVIPLSLLPAAMILYAGGINGAYYAPDAPFSRWIAVSVIFFCAEIITVSLMATVIRQIAAIRDFSTDRDSAYLLAALGAVPLWLSALTLFVPSIAFNAFCGMVGLGASFCLLYHGVPSLLGTSEDIEAQDVAYLVMSVGAAAWALLCAIVLVPLFF
ncbi:Yip1 family protein [Jeongeupia sp. USM3]|uniref:Yip1 family protein n=1 Tax=Jeongeupia sp. USM3 TaxID=1906741 RepID=UPI00089DEBB6|nr:Yip1 family protein [Jeongeupia sp. USM3]AOX99789.1 hypothetical protein BJP62_04540 [Jeongeupia sp. USM3]